MTDVKFGPMIRATRLGWGLSRKHGCFIRMSDGVGMESLIEFAPINDVPSKRLKGYHRCWWDDPSFLSMVPWIDCIRRVKRQFAVIVDEQGKIVRAA